MGNKKKLVLFLCLSALILWLMAAAIDYFCVSRFEMPLFTVNYPAVYKGAEDYRHCQGLGYSIEIAGSFDTTDEFPGVTRYTYFLFGKEICSGIRD